MRTVNVGKVKVMTVFFLDKFLKSVTNLVTAKMASFRFDIQYVQQQESTNQSTTKTLLIN